MNQGEVPTSLPIGKINAGTEKIRQAGRLGGSEALFLS